MTSNSKHIPQVKFFVSCADTQIGQAIIEQVRNDHLNDKNPHIIQGTKSELNIGPMPKAVKMVINNKDVRALTKTLIDSDVIIYDLSTAKLDEVEYAIKVLKMANYDNEKILILISSVMAWSNTPPKEKAAGDLEDEDVSVLHQTGLVEDISQNDTSYFEDIAKGYVPYREKDFARRKPSSKYEIYKAIETQCLNAGSSRTNLLSYVLCSGVLYGNGENVFAKYFKQAWLQSPEALSYVGDGSNVIPTIHVKDLATYVQYCINRRPSTRYLFAIDHARNPTLKSHVEAISKNLGTGKTQSISIMDAINEPFLDILKLNIRLQPSRLVDQLPDEESPQLDSNLDDEFDELERNSGARFRFNWWAKDGLRKNIKKVVEEFNMFRGLKTLKVFLTGPPASGKSYFGAKLAAHYNVPHINVKDVVSEVQELQNEFGEEVRTTLAQLKEKMIIEAEAQLEDLKKKKKKGQPDPVVDPEKIVPRLPDDLLYKAYKYILSKGDATNRGYILDGFPRTYEDARGVFLVEPLTAELKDIDQSVEVDAAGEPVQEQVPRELDRQKLPEYIVRLEATDEFLKNRVKGLPEEIITGTHHNEEGLLRRLPLYTKNNVSETGNPTLMTFFEEIAEAEKVNLKVLSVKCDENPGEETFDLVKAFIEKDGKVKNYQDAEEIAELKRKKQEKLEQEAERKRQEDARREQEEREAQAKFEQEERARLKLEAIITAEKILLDERSQPLRQYLADLVVPMLTSGIIEICKEKPEDPVLYLSDYLYKKSAELRNSADKP